MKPKKIVLAYSGGLDTSVMIQWLKEKYDAEIIAFAADLGQGEDLTPLREKALATGASKIYIEDLQEEFVREYIFPALKADAVYEKKYLLATALSRPLIAKKLVEIARLESADAVAHGCTGKGNDQVRFEVGISTLSPELQILAPARGWEFKSREEEMEYAQKHNIPVSVKKGSLYSIDKNLWGISVECGVIEDPAIEPPDDSYQIVSHINNTPDTPEYVEIEFEAGVPVGMIEPSPHPSPMRRGRNSKRMNPVELIMKLNTLGGRHGVGRVDMVENRVIGIKSREVYEAPAAYILHEAHWALQALILDRECSHFKETVALKYAELIYYGLWFTPLTNAFDAFVETTQAFVTGTVRLKLYKGSVNIAGRMSPFSLYSHKLATYDAEDAFDHTAAEGFVKIGGRPYKHTNSAM
ncbi:argininosuccinate synthase [Candidatus Desantisbacteria bacterium]|nr:argininosuccinate synthase [Candidatus Desantisbacteria bacterium]